MELWELAARERIRDSLARYNWSGDALRLDEVTQTFCEEGELEVRGHERLRGKAAILDFLRGISLGSASGEALRSARGETSLPTPARRVVRHNVTNVRFVEVTPAHTHVESYFTVLTEIGLANYGRYRDRFVPVGDEWLIQYRFVSIDWRAPGSTIAVPSAAGGDVI
jgi:hypothetical protein